MTATVIAQLGVILVLGWGGPLRASEPIPSHTPNGAVNQALPPKTYKVSDLIPEAPPSLYSAKVYKFLEHWPPQWIPELRPDPQAAGKNEKNPVWTRAIKTPGKGLYIGSMKQVWINAPMERVVAVLDDFASYPKFFDDVKKVEVRARDGNKLTVFWERNSPAFFIPNIKYEMIYLVEKISPTQTIYRYQLKKGNSLNASDGVIVVDAEETGTKVTGLDFYDASWGLAGAIASGKIWRKSIEGGYKGDISFKMRVEHPDWKFDQIKDEAERMLERFPVEPIQYVNDLRLD